MRPPFLVVWKIGLEKARRYVKGTGFVYFGVVNF